MRKVGAGNQLRMADEPAAKLVLSYAPEELGSMYKAAGFLMFKLKSSLLQQSCLDSRDKQKVSLDLAAETSIISISPKRKEDALKLHILQKNLCEYTSNSGKAQEDLEGEMILLISEMWLTQVANG